MHTKSRTSLARCAASALCSLAANVGQCFIADEITKEFIGTLIYYYFMSYVFSFWC